MTKQITLEEVLKLVTVEQDCDYNWYILDVKCDVEGDVEGKVKGDVWGTINGRPWEFIETPEEKFRRLLDETGNQELIDAFKQYAKKTNEYSTF